jgi:hypothetical protein
MKRADLLTRLRMIRDSASANAIVAAQIQLLIEDLKLEGRAC